MSFAGYPPTPKQPVDADTIRVGVIGTGFGASLHLSALRECPGFTTVAIASRRADRARAAAQDHNIPAHFSDYRELVRHPDIDAVIVATPPHLHHPMAIAALEHDKHVLCEKPMARNLAEAKDMLRIAERTTAVAMVNNQLRFLPARVRIAELIGEGYIGEPHAASVVVHRSSLNDPHDRPWGWLMEAEKAGGMLGATGAHYVDALRWWFGEVKGVAGAVSTMVRQRRLPDSSAMGRVDADDNFAVLLRFANNALGSVHVSATAGHEGAEQITLSGAEGTLELRDGVLFGARRGDFSLLELPIPDRLMGGLAPGGHFLVQPTTLLLRAWGQAIRDGLPASPSFADGVKTQELLDGALRSSQQGRWIDTSGTRWPQAG
ncbi:MAG: Gfo/Idh/MocA family oxidoreductase [Chloroflexia bacterium]|nr:Gfo/Idh/MocA family oxidoreductase [Chloroflexia bacterium]